MKVCGLLMLGLILFALPALPIALEEGKFVHDGQQVFLKGAMYWQPTAYHQWFWDGMDLEKLEGDLDQMKGAGMNLVILGAQWGEFVESVDQSARTWTPKADNVAKFLTALELIRERGMFAMLWFSISKTPEGINAKWHDPAPDKSGYVQPGFAGFLWHDYPACAQYGEYQYQAFLEFHTFVASLTRPFDNVLFDPLDWQHLSINYWDFAQPKNLAAWREWLQGQNPDLAYWNERWSEANATWEEVLFPVDSWVQNTIGRHPAEPYIGLPEQDYTGPKWQDFRSWHNPLFNQIQEGVIEALRMGAPEVPIGQRYDMWHFGDFRQATWAPEGVDFLCFGYYPYEASELGSDATLERDLGRTLERLPRPLPMICWEVGAEIARLMPEADLAGWREAQATQVKVYLDFARKHDMLGMAWWVWRDYWLDQGADQWGLVEVDDTPKPALKVFGEN